MKIKISDYIVKPDSSLDLSSIKTSAIVAEPSIEMIEHSLKYDTQEISKLQYKLFAENRQSLLIVFQGMDSSGKDGTIKHLMSGVNPQGALVHSFKHPSDLELEHNFLWRHYLKLPERGQIAIFNRSHYENVLISKVHPEILMAEKIPGIMKKKDIKLEFWKERYKQINHFEKSISDGGTVILKFFLHLSKDEQKKRFLERLENKEKHWKFSSADIQERKFWKEYQEAYEQAIAHTSKKNSPWYIIPADNKWFTRLIIGKIILQTLQKMNPQFPNPTPEEEKSMQEAIKYLKK